ncbi:hypothetical protein [Methylobacterium soli]|uniref:Uncharacterized protein n=1 Tax=Methylobacterium soli TaxID=553447 RepID=A0A6L3SZ12_9HYPH|nr:hypothetical protein [Methylobacterium soli]KAB1079351.1 hypothetical protein F6X53_11125 [Methylobacterium soli]GJE41276.1 hypothetical protein AEGHOMDF_0438 [Methylobacterium soli]
MDGANDMSAPRITEEAGTQNTGAIDGREAETIAQEHAGSPCKGRTRKTKKMLGWQTRLRRAAAAHARKQQRAKDSTDHPQQLDARGLMVWLDDTLTQSW